jgi:hypothetical protein
MKQQIITVIDGYVVCDIISALCKSEIQEPGKGIYII